MKKYKLAVMLFLLLLVTGCDINYNATITDDLVIIDEVNIKNKIIANTDIKLFLEEKVYSLKNNEGYGSFDITSSYNSTDYNIKLSKIYRNYEIYKVSPMVGFVFEGIMIKQEDDYTEISTIGTTPYTKLLEINEYDPDIVIEEFQVNLKFYNNIITSNADSYNNTTNTLTWNFNNIEDDQKIYIKLGKSKRYDIIILDFLYRNLVNAAVFGFMFILISAAALFFLSIYKIKDKI